jgi:hypothetical protein
VTVGIHIRPFSAKELSRLLDEAQTHRGRDRRRQRIQRIWMNGEANGNAKDEQENSAEPNAWYEST